MAVEINPIPLFGSWDLGFALDTHVIESIPLGEDAYGYFHFENKRSPIGELLYQFKYNSRYDNLAEIVDTIICFLDAHPQMKNIETVLPVPPTKVRGYQPTFEIAQALAKAMKVFYCTDVLVNTSQIEAKGLSASEKHQLAGTIVKRKPATRKHSTLLIDDLYQTGTTLNQCVSVLRKDPLIDNIYVLTITKTKNQ